MIFLDELLCERPPLNKYTPTHVGRHEKLVIVFHIYLYENVRQISEKDTHTYLKSNAIDSNEIVSDETKKKILRQIVFRIQRGGPHAVQDEWEEGNTNQLVQGES